MRVFVSVNTKLQPVSSHTLLLSLHDKTRAEAKVPVLCPAHQGHSTMCCGAQLSPCTSDSVQTHSATLRQSLDFVTNISIKA